LCLALISLACLDTSGAVIAVDQPPEVATRINLMATTTPALVKIGQSETTVAPVCARVIASSAQNLRIDAGLSSRILGHLLNGDLVQVIDQANRDWWHVRRGDDIGFARSSYLEEVECADE